MPRNAPEQHRVYKQEPCDGDDVGDGDGDGNGDDGDDGDDGDNGGGDGFVWLVMKTALF